MIDRVLKQTDPEWLVLKNSVFFAMQLSLPEVNGSVRVPAPHKAWYKKYWSYAGLGFLISVGYSAPPPCKHVAPIVSVSYSAAPSSALAGARSCPSQAPPLPLRLL